jgi:DNA-binding XRE family transcriptional regulator
MRDLYSLKPGLAVLGRGWRTLLGRWTALLDSSEAASRASFSVTHHHRSAMADLARLLRRVREENDLAQEEVAHRAEVAVFTYSSLERANTSKTVPNPTILTVISVFRALGLDNQGNPVGDAHVMTTPMRG